MKEKIEYLIEYKAPNSHFYSRKADGFTNKKIAMITASHAKKMSPTLGVRVVELKRKILNVF